MSAPIDILLPRLEAVRALGPGRWMARCPGHEDERPSLSIQETSDTTILIHCFAACAPAAVLGAVGLELRDLFPERAEQYRHHRGRQRPFLSARDVLKLLDSETLFMAAIAFDIAAGRPVEAVDFERIGDVRERILRLKEIVR